MNKTRPGTCVQLLGAPLADAEISVRAPTQDPGGQRLPDPGYSCSVCCASWPYREVRNTGRCPACGSGLLRAAGRA